MRRSTEPPLRSSGRDLQVASTDEGKWWGDFNWDVQAAGTPRAGRKRGATVCEAPVAALRLVCDTAALQPIGKFRRDFSNQPSVERRDGGRAPAPYAGWTNGKEHSSEWVESWSAPAERSGDGAFERAEIVRSGRRFSCVPKAVSRCACHRSPKPERAFQAASTGEGKWWDDFNWDVEAA